MTEYLEIAGIMLLAVFGFAVWAPLCLLVVGAACLAIARAGR